MKGIRFMALIKSGVIRVSESGNNNRRILRYKSTGIFKIAQVLTIPLVFIYFFFFVLTAKWRGNSFWLFVEECAGEDVAIKHLLMTDRERKWDEHEQASFPLICSREQLVVKAS